MAHPVHAKVINPKRDPFDMIVSAKSLVASSPKIQRSINKDVIESVKLTGVIWDPENPYAVVQMRGKKKILRIGDTIRHHKVIKISKSNMVIQKKKSKVTLEVGKEKRL